MKLVVTADDLGLSPAVTRGIVEAHRRGVVRSTSLLVTFPGAEEAAALARAERGLEVGLHLDLVGGTPAAEPSSVRSLVDAEGRFHRLAEFTRRLLTGRIRTGDVARELRAQAARARAWGIEARAWDSHRHVHLMVPVARIVSTVAREHAVRWIRRAAPPSFPREPKSGVLGIASAIATLVAYRGIPGNDWYVDLSSWRPELDAAGVALLAARGGIGELGAHPGYVDAALADRDGLVARRERDLALLTDPVVVAALRPTAWRVLA